MQKITDFFQGIDWNFVQAFSLFLTLIVVISFVAVAFDPADVKIAFPDYIPEDIHGVYWLLLKGSSGISMPGDHTHMVSPSNEDWVRSEAMYVDPEFIYEWRWEYKGETYLSIQAVPGVCYQIGEQKLKVNIWKEEDSPFWGYEVVDCSWSAGLIEDLFGKKY